MSGLAVTDVEIYRGNSVTQRASDNGITLVDTDGIDIDGQTGFQGFEISLADNSDAGFYGQGHEFWVYVNSVTINSQTVAVLADHFVICHEGAILDTTIASLSSQTSFTLTDGPAEDDAINGMWVAIHDVASAVQKAIAVISDYTGSSKTVTLAAAPTFTIAATDNISVMGPMPLQPTVGAIQSPGRTLSVGTDNAAQADVLKVSTSATAADNLESAALNYSATRGLAGTALPAAAAGSAGGLPTDSAGKTSFNDLSQANVRTAVGLASANIDTQFGLVATAANLATLAAKFTGITLLAEWLGLIAGKQTGNSTARTELRATGAGSGTFDETTDSLEAGRDNVGTAGAGLTAADDAVISAIGALNNISSANVKTQADQALADVGLTTVVTGRIDRAISAILTTAMTEAYNADGAAPTPAQALFLIMQRLTEHSVSGTTWTFKKLDGSTTAFVLTLNDATNPTAVTRSA